MLKIFGTFVLGSLLIAQIAQAHKRVIVVAPIKAAEQRAKQQAAEKARIAAEEKARQEAAEQARLAAEEARIAQASMPIFKVPMVIEFIFNQRENGYFQGCEVGIMKSGIMAVEKCSELPQVKSGEYRLHKTSPDNTGALEDRGSETCQVRSFFVCEIQPIYVAK